MLVYTYDYRLVAASIVISMMAAFTGLCLTRGLSALPVGARQLRVCMAAIALGGGIWSMHFVAMLAMRFGTLVYYEALQTVASVLIAILQAGLALLLMHFGTRTLAKSLAAGTVLGLGIVTMHYVGLSGIEGCVPVYDPVGFVVAGVLAIAMGIAAILIAYGERSGRNIVLATVVFGASVVIVHFTAMYWTGFAASAEAAILHPVLSNGQLALVVVFIGFLISGAFLLTGASFVAVPPVARSGPAVAMASGHMVEGLDLAHFTADPPRLSATATTEPPAAPVLEPDIARLPYEREGVTYFLPARDVLAIRAEGHYTIAYTATEKLFCPWSISEAEKRLPEALFLRVHRSYMVNTARVGGFERHKDNGVCLFDGPGPLEKVPVSRARIPELRERLGL